MPEEHPGACQPDVPQANVSSSLQAQQKSLPGTAGFILHATSHKLILPCHRYIVKTYYQRPRIAAAFTCIPY